MVHGLHGPWAMDHVPSSSKGSSAECKLTCRTPGGRTINKILRLHFKTTKVAFFRATLFSVSLARKTELSYQQPEAIIFPPLDDLIRIVTVTATANNHIIISFSNHHTPTVPHSLFFVLHIRSHSVIIVLFRFI
jgi:hypothetical protein